MNDETAAAAAALAALMARVQAATISGLPPRTTSVACNNSNDHDDDDEEEELEDEEEEEDGGAFKIPQRYTKSGRKRAVSFALKLMKVLSDRNLAHIVTWTPSGKSFVILKPKAFTEEVLPEHFKSAKFSSFTRKLHRWGFMRHYRGEEAGAYYHDEFQRGRLDMVEKMSCHRAPSSSMGLSVNHHHNETTEMTKDVSATKANDRPVIGPSRIVSASNAFSLPSTPLHDPLRAPAGFSMFSSLKKGRPILQQGSPCLSTAYQRPFGFGPGFPSISSSIASPSPISPTQSNALVAAEINAAIELEVSRRLQERIQQAASQFVVSRSPTIRPTSSADNDSSAALRAKLFQLRQQKEQLERLGMSGCFVSMPSRGLPPAQAQNIQGAKTA